MYLFVYGNGKNVFALAKMISLRRSKREHTDSLVELLALIIIVMVTSGNTDWLMHSGLPGYYCPHSVYHSLESSMGPSASSPSAMAFLRSSMALKETSFF